MAVEEGGRCVWGDCPNQSKVLVQSKVHGKIKTEKRTCVLTIIVILMKALADRIQNVDMFQNLDSTQI